VTEDELARKCADAMYERDNAARGVGIELLEARAGFSRCAMTIRDTMINGHDSAHGGFIFTLADSAFAYACNSYNEPNVALQCSISFIAAVRLGDRLIATAQRAAKAGRTGVYDVVVERDETTIALFRGVNYRIRGTVLGEA
jgi:acyl-CoA thioesterase